MDFVTSVAETVGGIVLPFSSNNKILPSLILFFITAKIFFSLMFIIILFCHKIRLISADSIIGIFKI